MNKFFSVEGPLIRTFDDIGKLIILSFLWVLCSLPIITMGYATVALYYTVVKTIRCDTGYAIQEFFGALKREWKQGLLASVIHILAIVLFSIDAYMWYHAGTKQGLILGVVCAAFTVFVILMGVYLYTLISRFELTLKELFKMAAFLEFKYLHYTVGAGFVLCASLVLLWLTPWFLFIVPGVAVLLISLMIEKIFILLIPEPEGDRLEWYDEERKKEEKDAYEESN